jgi:hypothetical protein
MISSLWPHLIPWLLQTWIYTKSGSLHINPSFFGQVVLEKKIFKWSHPIFAVLWLFPLWRGTDPLYEQTWISFTQEWFVPSLIEIDQQVLEKIFIDFFQSKCRWKWFPLLWPHQTPGDPDILNLNLHYVRKLS